MQGSGPRSGRQGQPSGRGACQLRVGPGPEASPPGPWGVCWWRGGQPLIGWSPCRYVGAPAGCGGRGRGQVLRVSLPVGVPASCVGAGLSPAGPVPLRGVSAGCVGRGRGQAVRVSLPVGVSAGSGGLGAAAAGWEAVVAAGGAFVGGLGGGVAHSSWGAGRAGGVIPTFFRPGGRR